MLRFRNSPPNRSVPCHVWERDRGGFGTRHPSAESHPTSKARHRRQKAKAMDAKARESAPASGVAAITPEGSG